MKMTIKQYVAKRDAAVLSAVRDGDLEPLKALGRAAGAPVFSDEVILISAHKMCCNITTMPEELRKKSRKWLLAHGSTPRIG